jgi:type I restriction enzyme S subunit
MAALSLAVPPIGDQFAIAAFLDRETAKIDALMEEQQRLIALLKEKRQAVISHAVTKGLDPNAPMKDSGVEWLGEVPKHWDIRSLANVARAGTTVTYGIVQAGPDVEGGIPYIRTTDMAGDYLPEEGYLRTSAEIDSAYSRSKVRIGDLVIAIRATIGKPLIVPSYLDGANLTQGTAKFSPDESVSANYIQLFLRSTGAEQEFQRLGKGATFKEITLEMLRKFRIARPPLNEQQEIVSFLTRATHKLTNLITESESAVTLLQERRNALISAAVTGKIDVRGLAPSQAEAA